MKKLFNGVFWFFALLFGASSVLADEVCGGVGSGMDLYCIGNSVAVGTVCSSSCADTGAANMGYLCKAVPDQPELCTWARLQDQPVTPPPNPFPFLSAAIAAAVALAAGLLAGVAVLVGAPVIVASAAGALAIAAAVAAMPGFGPANTAQGALNAGGSPVTVNLTPESTTPGPPLAGDTSPPSVVVAPDGTFVPGGGGLFSGNGATGGWGQNGATGSWEYTPAPTAENPSPAVIAEISQGGTMVARSTPSTNGGPPSQVQTVAKASDGTVIVVNGAQVPVTSSTGDLTTVDAAVVQTYTSTGAPTSTAAPPVYVSETLGNGAPSGGGEGLTPLTPAGTGGGTGGGTGTGTGTGTGSGTGEGGSGCGGVDCATETTQLANKGLLTSINGALSSTVAAPGDPVAKTGDDIKGAGLNKGSGVFSGLLGWSLPGHASVCPTSSFDWQGRTFTFDAHCQLASDHFGALRAVMTAVYAMSALFVVLRA